MHSRLFTKYGSDRKWVKGAVWQTSLANYATHRVIACSCYGHSIPFCPSHMLRAHSAPPYIYSIPRDANPQSSRARIYVSICSPFVHLLQYAQHCTAPGSQTNVPSQVMCTYQLCRFVPSATSVEKGCLTRWVNRHVHENLGRYCTRTLCKISYQWPNFQSSNENKVAILIGDPG